MKYTKLFNNHYEYVAYTASTSFVKPNISYCISEDEPHLTPADFCQEGHEYEVSNIYYPSTVAASATSFDLSFDYEDTYTTIDCHQTITTGSEVATITIEENPTPSARTISGVYVFNGVEIEYSLEQEASPYQNMYLTLDILTSGDIAWKKTSGMSGRTISYSKDNGTTWTDITSTESGTVFTVSAGDKVLLKGNNSEYAYSDDYYTSFNASELANAATYNVQGNIMSLTDGDDFRESDSFEADWALAFIFDSSNVASAKNLVLPVLTLTKRCYSNMFRNASMLTTAPKLPATTLAENSYRTMFGSCSSLTNAPSLSAVTSLSNYSCNSMFRDCTSLTTAPELPATTLAERCYEHMFSGCTSLTTVPSNYLLATTLASHCYRYMFSNCTSLTTAPELPATTLADACYRGMFNGCTSLATIPSNYLPATTLANECYYSMFKGCSNLTNVVNLPATTLANHCYREMYDSCSKLTTVPNNYLPVTSLKESCYRAMFASCSSLQNAPELPATKLAKECYYSMFSNCKSLTTAPDLLATTLANSCYMYMFSSCSNLTTVSDLPATTLADACYRGMFNGCTSLATIPSNYLPTTTLATGCYKGMFKGCTSLTTAPQLPATTLTTECYHQMFHECTSLTTAPELPATTLVNGCYYQMYYACKSLTYIKCMAIDISAANCTSTWVQGVASSGNFVKASVMEDWTRGNNGIPTNWTVHNEEVLFEPTISFDGLNEIELSCLTTGASIYYKLYDAQTYTLYNSPITITADTIVEAYSEKNGESSSTVSMECDYVSDVPLDYSNRDLKKWNYNNQEVTTPYSVNAIDGHSSNYAKGNFTFETSFVLRDAQPTYLWFQHADQSAEIYIDNTLVEKHWGGYAAFTTDISQQVHSGTNEVKVILKNNEGNNLAPADADFNFNATLGNVKLLTSTVLPGTSYGYDGFHITSTVSDEQATINIKTIVPTGATLVCTIDSGNTNIYSATSASTGAEMTFTKVISNPHLWNGTIDPFLYTVTLEIYKDNELYHRFVRPYGLRYYEYVINDTEKVGTSENPYTGFLLNGSPYLLRGCCMHDDIVGKANALNGTDYATTFATIQELGLNFLRLAHYPHPKETYDWCDRLGIVVQTEGPCVNKLQSTMPEQYYTHLTGQYTDMVNQHYNHPCIFFWGLSNETSTDDKAFGKQKVEEYTALIKGLDSERLVGYVLAQGNGSSPSAYYNDPAVDWFGCNIYVGWYASTGSNNPNSEIQSRVNNTVYRVNKPVAYSEYGCGGTQKCHSDSYSTTTNKGSGGARHDIEYMMWLHEGHIATIKQHSELLFTSQWQLFDIAVAKRDEGYTECLDGINTSINDELRRLNDKGLVERDHVTKKDPFYLYKAWWNPTPFVHICQKDYTKMIDRVIKCYTNQTTALTLKVNGTTVETKTPTDNILTFTAHTFSSGDVVTVEGNGSISDTFTFS